MKLNAKLFLLTFTIITFVSVTSAFIYHTLTQKLLQDQQSESLINSANDFIFSFQRIVEKIDDELPNAVNFNNYNINHSNLDFILSTNSDSMFSRAGLFIKSGKSIYAEVNSLSEFLKFNTNLIVRQKKINNKTYIYGNQLDSKILNDLSGSIRAEVAFVDDGVISLLSNNLKNVHHLPYLSIAARELKDKNNFEFVVESLDNFDISVTHFLPKNPLTPNKLEFLIYSISEEAAVFKSTMNTVTATIVITGILLTIVSLFLFTSKFRKQLEYIMQGVSAIAAGENNTKVKILSNDEIGKLGNAFNNMLNEIEKRDIAEKEYTEFISLINKNPTLKKIGNKTLQKIVDSTNVDVGALYINEGDELIPFAALGAKSKKVNLFEESNFYKKATDNKEIIEIHFDENHPVVKSGIADLKLNYLYLLPIVYNDEVIAIMELASVNKPAIDIKQYFAKIKDQLSIGLANGKALTRLEKLVIELQELNDAYQEQNIKVTKQNDELILLHDQLKKGTDELEIERAKAVESAKLKSEFLANMSHELRTPQNSILGLTELVLKDDNTPLKTKERLNVVLRNGKKLLNLIENILEFSKLESGNIEITKSDISLSELVDEVKSFIDPLFLEREIELKIEHPQNYPYELNVDVRKVEQIIFNLIGNAAKFTKEGYVKLIIKIEGSDLVINVQDTGPGISEEDIKIIFEEFRQADANLNRKYSGTGLGLAICKRYTDLLKGEIEVKSNLGEGSQFYVYLPDSVKKCEKMQISIPSTNNPTNQLSAMIISEGVDATKLISDYLISNNIIVDIPGTEQINLNLILENNPDVIIFDVLVKNINGWQLLHNIKSNSKASKIPVIIINMDEEANCGLGLNILNYCVHKLDRNSVHKTIDSIEEVEAIKFRKVVFIVNDEKYYNIENELLFDDLKFYQTEGTTFANNFIRKHEPDLIIIDLFDKKLNMFNILNDINNDLYTKDIPIIAFISEIPLEDELNKINNNLFETTLIAQKHPLDVLKVIKDRIDLIDSNIFVNNKNSLNSENKGHLNLGSTNSNHQSNKIKVLITDDDDDARFTIGEIIESLGYEAIYATDGYECLEVLKSDIPDLILLDIMMPKMDGFQTIKKIRSDKRFSTLHIYALTAYAMLSDKEIVEKNGFSGLLTKPINTQQLEHKLKYILSLAE